LFNKTMHSATTGVSGKNAFWIWERLYQ